MKVTPETILAKVDQWALDEQYPMPKMLQVIVKSTFMQLLPPADDLSHLEAWDYAFPPELVDIPEDCACADENGVYEYTVEIENYDFDRVKTLKEQKANFVPCFDINFKLIPLEAGALILISSFALLHMGDEPCTTEIRLTDYREPVEYCFGNAEPFKQMVNDFDKFVKG